MHYIYCTLGGSDGKISAYNAGDPGSIPGSGRSPGEGNGNPFQYSCLENPIDGGTWGTVHGVTKSRTRLNVFTFFMISLLQERERNLHPVLTIAVWGEKSSLPYSKTVRT